MKKDQFSSKLGGVASLIFSSPGRLGVPASCDIKIIDEGPGKPYVTQWISNHPQGSNREAILLPNIKTGKAIQVHAMFRTYKIYKKYFESLLSSKDVPEEDKKRIRDLLNKRWNPYVLSHSAITEKSGMLSSDSKLRQYAGWTPRSNMHYKYVHFGGGESMNDLLKAKGILKDDKHSVNILAPKICPHCKEQNRPDAQFCYKCNFVISFEAHQKSMEERERKDQEIRELKEQVGEIQWLYEDLIKRNITVRNFTKDGVEIFDGFGNRISSRPLTKEERKKIDEPTND